MRGRMRYQTVPLLGFVLAVLVDNIPIRRAGTDDEVGGFVAYLCTQAASWIHGQSININGGQLMEL